MQKKFDAVEPYLEPLYLPAVFGFVALVFNNFFGTHSNSYLSASVVFALYGMVIATVMVVVYELRLLFGLVPRGVIFSTENKIYRVIRWIAAAFGMACVLYSTYFVFVGVMLIGLFRGR